jgi:hypothetical protein
MDDALLRELRIENANPRSFFAICLCFVDAPLATLNLQGCRDGTVWAP